LPQWPSATQVSTTKSVASLATAGRSSSVKRRSDDGMLFVSLVWWYSPKATTCAGVASTRSSACAAVAKCSMGMFLRGNYGARRRLGRKRHGRHAGHPNSNQEKQAELGLLVVVIVNSHFAHKNKAKRSLDIATPDSELSSRGWLTYCDLERRDGCFHAVCVLNNAPKLTSLITLPTLLHERPTAAA
jgi:hypothetical protein